MPPSLQFIMFPHYRKSSVFILTFHFDPYLLNFGSLFFKEAAADDTILRAGRGNGRQSAEI